MPRGGGAPARSPATGSGAMHDLLGREMHKAALLTARQEELLLHCYGKGYYEIPRRSTLRALAKGLAISSASLSLVLRRAEAKVVAAHALHSDGKRDAK
ncbi:MAG TPA: helix-turn-helix domain-containing protein [Candidatus Thermoplasmatota archaeon]|nr:helix-turn-helix domain-containing protein [Candidatus Thermoplasmatota archaeon]